VLPGSKTPGPTSAKSFSPEETSQNMAAELSTSFPSDAPVSSEGTMLPSRKDGLETPDTGTPPPRSVSPSSASDAGAPCEREGPLSRQRAREANAAHEADVAAISAATESLAIVEVAPAVEEATVDGGDETVSISGGADSGAGSSSATTATLPVTDVRTGKRGKASRKDKDRQAGGGSSVSGAKGGQRQAADDAAGEQAPEQANSNALINPPVGFSGFQMAMPPEAMGFSDRRIVEVLAAPACLHARLLQTAKRVPEIILAESEGGGALSSNVELYGSLSLDMTEPDTCVRGRERKQDWASYYINGRSDVDFVVEVRNDTPPAAICERLRTKGKWTIINETQVHKFASTQYTLRGNFDGDEDESAKVYLDITCIESPLHYSRFKIRQEAFRTVFASVRTHMEAQFKSQGALAYDAYIHLLKAFAAKVPGNALTGFQATCIGLFTLQIGHYRFKNNQSIALSLFEGFLRFCRYFFGDAPTLFHSAYWQCHYRTCGIDLSNGGRWIPRMSLCWRSELYFMAAEVKMTTRLDERVNVLHSLDPDRVSSEAQALLTRAFGGGASSNAWFQQKPMNV